MRNWQKEGQRLKMRIYDQRVNHLKNPFGYKMKRAVFSWKVDGAKGTRQESARIIVTTDAAGAHVAADTGFDKTADSLCTQVEMKLLPRTRYYWTVTVRTDAGETAVSDRQWFETGKMDEAWEADWITCDSAEPRHPYIEKKICPAKNVKSARLYICGLGLYEAYYNGEKIGDEYLTPYCNRYDKWLQVQSFDLTEKLKENGTLSVLLGNGWYKGRFVSGESYFGSEWKLIAELRVLYEDGSEEVIGTDESWKVRRSHITFSGIYDGEGRDDTLPELPAVPAAKCEAPAGMLTDRMSLPVKAREIFRPKEVIRTPKGENVLDLGQEISGIFTLRVCEPAGTVIRVQTGEVLQQGNFYRENLRSAKSEYIYVSDGNEQILKPVFTFYGYRYVKIEGISELRAEDFTGIALYSDIEDTGFVSTGHPLVNQLLSNVRWGMKGNFVDVPTDCPQRDERLGWTGDAQVFCATANYLEDAYAFYAKYLFDLWQEQKSADGMVPMTVPAFGANEGCSSVWGDAALIIPWNLYTTYGDKSILEDQYGSMKAWVDYMQRIDGGKHGWREQFHYGDWLALDHPVQGEQQAFGGTDEDFIADVYYAYSASILAKAAELLGKTGDAAYYKSLSDAQYDEVRKEYYSSTGRCCIRTQTALLLTLRHHLSRREEWTKQLLLQMFKDSDEKLKTGFVGTPILCNVLSENGMHDLAYTLLLNEEYPGWLREVKLGATTIWERWNSLRDDGTISGTLMNSLNHYSFGSIAEWIFRYAAGLNFKEEAAGCRHAWMAPVPHWELGELEASYDSPAGMYRAAWKIVDREHLEVSVTVPFGCTAELTLPFAGEDVLSDTRNPMFAEVQDGVCHLKPGSYSVRYQTARCMKRVYSTADSLRDLLKKKEVADILTQKLGERIPQIPVEYQHWTLEEANARTGSQVTEKELKELNQIWKEL